MKDLVEQFWVGVLDKGANMHSKTVGREHQLFRVHVGIWRYCLGGLTQNPQGGREATTRARLHDLVTVRHRVRRHWYHGGKPHR